MQEIPKLFTVVAEWSSCVVFAVVLKNRFSRGKTAGILAGFLLAYAPDGDRHLVGRIVDSGDGADVSVYFCQL